MTDDCFTNEDVQRLADDMYEAMSEEIDGKGVALVAAALTFIMCDVLCQAIDNRHDHRPLLETMVGTVTHNLGKYAQRASSH